MLLAIDVGNTNTVLGLYRLDGEKPELAAHWRVTTHRSQTADEYGVLFVNLFEMNGFSTSQAHHIIISSVVPPVEGTLREVCETYFHTQPLFVEPGIKTGMPILQETPADLGADRLVNSIADKILVLARPSSASASNGAPCTTLSTKRAIDSSTKPPTRVAPVGVTPM